MLTSLRLHHFRCFDNLNLNLPENGAIFVGQNAQGKTSILEALCVGMRLHSPRTHKLSQLIKVGEERFGVSVSSAEHDWKVQYKEGSRILLDCDGESIDKPNDYLANTKILVWMANEDLQLVKGGGDFRRRFLDFAGAQISLPYRNALSKYRRALKARNLLLKSNSPRWQEIDAYTALLVDNGRVIAEVREGIVRELDEIAAEMHHSMSSSKERLDCAYLRAGGEDLALAFEQARAKETSLRQTVVGPHRDDVSLLLNGLPAKDFASEGQKRTLAVSLKLAQGAILKSLSQKDPVYLIDDVFGELDENRRNALMRHIPKRSQRFITTTAADWLDDKADLDCFLVNEALVSKR